jgi:hypothetical protein
MVQTIGQGGSKIDFGARERYPLILRRFVGTRVVSLLYSLGAGREAPVVFSVHGRIEVANEQRCVSVDTEAYGIVCKFSPLCTGSGVRLGGWSQVCCNNFKMLIRGARVRVIQRLWGKVTGCPNTLCDRELWISTTTPPRSPGVETPSVLYILYGRVSLN